MEKLREKEKRSKWNDTEESVSGEALELVGQLEKMTPAFSLVLGLKGIHSPCKLICRLPSRAVFMLFTIANLKCKAYETREIRGVIYGCRFGLDLIEH